MASSDESVATATIAADGTVTVTGLKEGTATITVTWPATNAYAGATKTYTVTVTAVGSTDDSGGSADDSGDSTDDPVDVTASSFTVADIADQVYDDTAKTPDLTVTDTDNKTITDYTVEWVDNVEVGTAAARVTWNGETATKTFSIVHLVTAGGTYFPDLEAKDWYMAEDFFDLDGASTLYLDYVVANGVMSGYDGGAFRPNATAARSEAAKMCGVTFRMYDANHPEYTGAKWPHGTPLAPPERGGRANRPPPFFSPGGVLVHRGPFWWRNCTKAA